MKLTGLVAATYTPFHVDGSIHPELIPEMVDHMIDRGADGFYVCGSTGEGESLSNIERMSIAEAFVSAAGGRVPVVIQVGHNSIEHARELARHAAAIKADAISTLPPTYFKPPTLELLIEYISRVTEAAPELSYYYYHIPRLSGVPVATVKLLEAVRDRIPSFAGIKFSDFFLAEMMACQQLDEGRYDILFGSDEMLLGALATGATGAVGSCYGFAAPLWKHIIAAYEARDMELAQAWMARAVELVNLLASSPGPFHACVKQVILPALGFEVGACRLPQATMTKSEVALARRQLEASGLLEEIVSGSFRLP
ncbi:MAG: dihydrodipicolinate synthase family protein [Verrucomicrobiota bacterium]